MFRNSHTVTKPAAETLVTGTGRSYKKDHQNKTDSIDIDKQIDLKTLEDHRTSTIILTIHFDFGSFGNTHTKTLFTDNDSGCVFLCVCVCVCMRQTGNKHSKKEQIYIQAKQLLLHRKCL